MIAGWGFTMNAMKKVAGAFCAVALSLGAMAATAKAEDKINYAITITGVSDYMFRGISFTEEDPAFQPYIEFTYNIFYLAFWGSNIDSGGVYGPWELDIYAGIRPVTGPISWDLAIWYYQYGSQDDLTESDDLDYVELKAAATVTPITNASFTLTGYYTPDQDLASGETWTIDGLLSYTLPQVGIFVPTISGQLGYTEATDWSFAGPYFLGEASSYTFWNVGVKLAVEKFFMDLRYWDTDLENDLADERFLFSAGVNLP
jgi:uncharacterized protein (TIGR02001 family)